MPTLNPSMHRFTSDQFFEDMDGDLNADASDLGFAPGDFPSALIIDGVPLTVRKRLRCGGEFHGYRYERAGQTTGKVYLWND